MAKIILKASCLILFFTFILVFPSQVFAGSITISSCPSSVEKLEEFDINFSVSLEANQQYYIKARIGEDTSSLTKAETYNPSTPTWLSDTSTWTDFPTITTGTEGNYSSNIKAKAKDTAQEGANKLTIRVRKVSTDSNIDSDPVDLQLTAASSTSYPTNIYLSEFMPNPAEGAEWVEIYNDNDNTADLSGWKIDDIEGGSSPHHFNAQIPAKSYFVIYLDLDSAKLNNDGDSVRLIKPDDSEADTASYDSSQNGISWAKDGGQWSETSTPTPGQVNKITSTEAGEQSTSNASPSPTTKSTSKSTPTSTQNSKTQETTKSYKTDTPNYDWEKQENPTPESSAISLVLGEKTDNPPKKIPIHIIFIFAGLFFFTAAFFPQIKTKIQDFLEERFQSQL